MHYPLSFLLFGFLSLGTINQHKLSVNLPTNASEQILTAKQDSAMRDTVLTYIRDFKEGEPECAKWKVPPKEKIMAILKMMKPLEGVELDLCYSDWGCEVKGELIYKNEKYAYWLNSSGWMTLSKPGTEDVRYGCWDGQPCARYFLDVGKCPE